MNIGRLSNDDGEGNKNVPRYRGDFNSLKMANVGKLPYGALGTVPKFGHGEEIEFVSVVTSSKQRRKRKFNVVFVQVVKKSALQAQNLLFFIFLLARFVWRSHCRRRYRRLRHCYRRCA